jgi:two-component system, OmpR family, KDP operon response regulator KdpE
MTTVLIVDDEPQIRRALSLNLGARAYEVCEATTGEEALAVVAAEDPDMVLLDLGLPGMDGMTVLRTLRERNDVAVIVLTVRDDERSRTAALEAGADDYVTKPFDMTDLVERIDAALRRNEESLRNLPDVVTDAGGGQQSADGGRE